MLCGGVGAARFLTGAVQVRPAASITAVVNTADDTVINGLAISPDLDTVVYTLAGAIDPQRGWGLRGETWTAMEALQRYVAVRPDTSTAAVTWFRLGDRDLATHLYRTARRGEGATLTEITAEIAAAWDVGVRVLPMTDGDVSTHLILADGSDLPFQDYFVRLHHDVEVSRCAHRDIGIASRRPPPSGRSTTPRSWSSRRPTRSCRSSRCAPCPGIDESLSRRRDTVVAVSPIIGGRALKGPADRLLRELGHEPSVVGVARIYAPIAAALVIDPVDAELAGAVEAAGMRPVVAPSVMSTPPAAAQLARATLDAAVSR